MSGWTAVVLAGSRPGIDAFAQSHGTDLKALIPVSGEPMVRRPVMALLADKRFTAVRVLAQQPERIAAVLPADPRLTFEPSGDTIAATLEAICNDPATHWPVLLTTADHALLDQADRRFAPAGRTPTLRLRSSSAPRCSSGFGNAPHLDPFRAAPIAAQSVFMLLSAKFGRQSHVAVGRTGPQEGLALLTGDGPRVFWSALRRSPSTPRCNARPQAQSRHPRRSAMANPLAAVDVDKQTTTAWSNPFRRAGHERSRDLRPSTGTVTAVATYTVPDPLRHAPRAVAAAALPVTAASILPCGQGDQPRQAQGNQHWLAARRVDPPQRPQALVDSSPTPTVARNIRPARETIARDKEQGRRLVLATGPTAVRRLHRRAVGLTT